MEPAALGLVLDSSVLIAAERARLTTPEMIRRIRDAAGNVTIGLCALTVAEVAHGIYRANTPERARMRRRFLDELKAHIPVHPFTESTAELVAQIGAGQAAQGINLPLADLIIGACALELGYAVGTANVRHFRAIPRLQVISI
jgi:predicted nucleic acid-binding protein